ncbi:MAG TPA: polysaccharide deacetylase family protein, partial [Pirellulaceae bacterium]
MKPRPFASLSLDLDNQWSYMKTHGDAGWSQYPSYLHLVVPRVLDYFQRRRLRITFFVVGQDAARPENKDPLRAIAEAGHEVANHSFHHEPWLHRYTRPQIEEELARAEEAIQTVTGATTRGFRGPGYSFSPTLFSVLAERDYVYDASTLPTFLGPAARAYYFFRSGLTAAQRRERAHLFGGIRDGLRPLHPFVWPDVRPELVEIPVTTIPLLRIPFHLSYLLYLGQWSRGLALAYFRNAVRWCRIWGVEPSFLLHPLDFLGGD